MKEIKFCKHCGAKMMEYRHILNTPLAKALYKLWEANPPRNLKDIGLTFNERANFQKLRYWGLVEKHQNKGERIDGFWNVTNKGINFLSGKITVYQAVITYRNVETDCDGERVYIHDLWDEIKYKTRPEYINDAQPHLSLFGDQNVV